MTNTELEKYPVEIQEQVKERLGAYSKVYVTRENGKYSVSGGICLTTDYAPDYRVDQFHVSDVLTDEEQDLAYINNFYSYPISYKGKRDYSELKKAHEEGAKFVYDDAGNFVLGEKEAQSEHYATLIEVINEELNTMQRLNATNDEKEDLAPEEYYAERDRIKTLWTTFENTICSVGAKMLSGVEYDRLIEYFEEVEPLVSLSNAFAGKEE